MGIDVASFYNFTFVFWKCSESFGILFSFYSSIKWVSMTRDGVISGYYRPHDITEILLKVALNTMNLTLTPSRGNCYLQQNVNKTFIYCAFSVQLNFIYIYFLILIFYGQGSKFRSVISVCNGMLRLLLFNRLTGKNRGLNIIFKCATHILYLPLNLRCFLDYDSTLVILYIYIRLNDARLCGRHRDHYNNKYKQGVTEEGKTRSRFRSWIF